MTRSCGTCTKCCEGYVGVPFPSESQSCLNVIKGGCAIYDIRPDHPCKSFRCGWLRDVSIPEELKPDKANIIMYPFEIQGIKYFYIISAGEVDKDPLKQYFTSNNMNILWDDKRIGSQEFLEIDFEGTIDKAHDLYY